MVHDKETAACDELSFEQVLSKLERVVAELGRGETPLEQAVALFEEGVRLSKIGANRLDEAERRVELLLGSSDEPQAQAFGGQKEQP